MQDKIRGVNLGAWLVLEKWMTPKLFDDTPSEDEYYLARDVEPTIYAEKIKTHRDTFITEGDFVKMKAAGINVVRIPVPHFIFNDRPPFIGCIDELDRAFNWAEAHDLKVLIDLHTAPLNQNAFDNGGISGVCRWAQHPEEIEFVLTVLTRLAERYKDRPALYGIEVLNEPLTEDMWEIIDPQDQFKPRDPELAKGSRPVTFEFLYDFYKEAYSRLRKILPADKAIVFHDGFDLSQWEAFFKDNKFTNVVLDTHHYLVFKKHPEKENVADYVAHLKSLGEEIRAVSKYVTVIAGEWSLFNKAVSERLPKPAEAITSEEKNKRQQKIDDLYRQVWKASTEAWDQGDGYFYWTYKLNIDTVNHPEKYGWDCWDLSRCLAKGWADI